MIEVVVASKNAAKIREIRRIMSGLPMEFLGPTEVGEWADIEESGQTYVENALIKAVAVSRVTGHPALADDSGLEVDALDGLPGVRSARFAGAEATDEQNNLRLASLLQGAPPQKRGARYRCVAVLWAPEGLNRRSTNTSFVQTGVCEGWIATHPKGTGGFGYDPWFIPQGDSRRMAELSDTEKDAISHRGKAFRGLRAQIESAMKGP